MNGLPCCCTNRLEQILLSCKKKIADDQAAGRHPKLPSHNEIKRGEKKTRFWQPQQRIKYQRVMKFFHEINSTKNFVKLVSRKIFFLRILAHFASTHTHKFCCMWCGLVPMFSPWQWANFQLKNHPKHRIMFRNTCM